MNGLCIKSKKKGSKIDRFLKNIGFSALVLHKILNLSQKKKKKRNKKTKQKQALDYHGQEKINRSMVLISHRQCPGMLIKQQIPLEKVYKKL